MHFSFAPFLLALEILLTWGVCALTLIGIGSLFLRRLVGIGRPLDAFWAGLFLAVLLLQIGHFLLPIAWPFALFLGGLGLAGLLLNGRILFSSGQSHAPGNSSAVASLPTRASRLWSLALAAAIALRCVGPCNHYDTGAYGAMAVRWYNTFPLVPGLANLMAQLGFHSSVLLCVAALNHGPWNGLAFHLFPGFLLSALVFMVVPAFLRVWRGASCSPGDLYLTVLIVPALFWATNSEIIGTNTDLPTTFVALAAFHYLLAGLHTPDRPDGPAVPPLLLALLLFPLALTFKISSVVLAPLGWVLAFAQLWRLGLPSQRRNLMLAAVLLPGVLLVTWGARGVVLSGYPFFPSTILGFPADWRLPANWADFQAQFVRSWARMPWASLSETQGWHWFGAWFRGVTHNRVDFIFPALFSIAGIVVLLRRADLRAARWLRIILPSVFGLPFWFWRAPAIRFAESMIWGVAAALGTAALLAALPAFGKNARRALLAGFLAAGIWCSYPRTLWRVFYGPAFEQREFPRLPQVPVAPYRVNENLTILVPYMKNQCWDSPLPCSPYFFDSLRLRRDSDLRYGFLNPNASGDFDKSRAFHKLYWTGPEPARDQF